MKVLRTVYIEVQGALMPLDKAIEIITDDFIKDGDYSNYTIMELRDACKDLLNENLRLLGEKEPNDKTNDSNRVA